jgi:lipopolysaccharide/colanic/teichoic acid biosynthesis glycosyltransferase
MFKRLFDIVISLVALTMLFPLLIITSIIIAKKLGAPVLFRQERPGLNGKPFQMLKFRSMLDINDNDGNPLSDKQRLSQFGRKLRATSLDELPSLISVLKGDMSLVGPRPLLMQYLPLYNKFQSRRHDVKPGITGWAQVNGRNAISWEQKFEYDVWYVENQSFWLDVRILLLTAKKVLLKDGISADGEATMLGFTGTDERDK